MRGVQAYLNTAVLILMLFCQCACRSENPAGNKDNEQADEVEVADAAALISETLSRFSYRTYSTRIAITKLYDHDIRFDEQIHLYLKSSGSSTRMLLQVLSSNDNKGMGVLIKHEGGEISSAWLYVPETKRLIEMGFKQSGSNVVIGGLSVLDFQILQGAAVFQHCHFLGRQEIDGRSCYAIEAEFPDKSPYRRAQLFTSVEERLPVLIRIQNQEGGLLKEISFDELERLKSAWAIKRLTVKNTTFGYTSTLTFERNQMDIPIADTLFTPETLTSAGRE